MALLKFLITLEDLTAAAINNAKSKLDEVIGGKMAALNIPAGLLG
jgi:DNA-binding protein YbaB